MAKPSPAETRAAKGFLRTHAKARSGEIPPRKFAAASKELGVGFRDLLRFIARLYSGGQGEGAFRMDRVRELQGKQSK
jgi:hypothetical protein